VRKSYNIESAIFYWEYQTMEPISLIVAALAAGAVAAAKLRVST